MEFDVTIRDGKVVVVMDPRTAELVADALAVVNPGNCRIHHWARDCAFTLQSFIDRLLTTQGE